MTARCASISDAAPCFLSLRLTLPVVPRLCLGTTKDEAVPHNYYIIEAQPHISKTCRKAIGNHKKKDADPASSINLIF
jgi:hypothetical protein